MHESVAATRVAIECLTLWLENAPESRLNAAQHIRGLITEPDGPGAAQIITGLLNLNTMVLLELMEVREDPAEDMLKEAGDYLREYSRQLPE